MATSELPPVTIEALLQIIGDKEVTLARQAAAMAAQAARLAELEPPKKSENDAQVVP
jgi:hypothetical protein